MSVNSKMTAIADAIRSLLGITGTLGLDAMATKLNGITKKAAASYTPGTTDQTINAGQYLSGAQTIKGDANLKSENIADGMTLFGIPGSHKGGTSLETSAVTVSTDLASAKVYYTGLSDDGKPIGMGKHVWTGSSATVNIVKGTVIFVHCGLSVLSVSSSANIEYISKSSFAFGAFLKDTAGDTETIAIAIDD